MPSAVLGRVVFVGSAPSSLDELRAQLRAKGFAVFQRASAEEALDLAVAGEIDAMIIEPSIASASITPLVAELTSQCPDVRAILLSGSNDYDLLVTAMRAGLFDCLPTTTDADALEATLLRALARRDLRHEVQRLRLALGEPNGFEELIGASPPMQALYDLIERAAETTASVLITGESGVGKELVARAIHRRSKRKHGPFVAINCSAIPDNLLESELFGHVRGAFTDAKIGRAGLFHAAAGGTVFLDEIGDMPLALQPKLLRTLQERTVRPVGGEEEIPIDVRLITATNVNLDAQVADRHFRQDLYYRVNVIHIEVPPLRERASDIILLAQHFVDTYAKISDKAITGISPAAARKLLAYGWPGNVRELQNCIERAVALTREREVGVDDLPEKIRTYKRSHVLVVSTEPAELVPMDEVERRYIVRVLQAVAGNKKEAARILGFDRKTLYRKLERYGLDRGMGRPLP